MNIKSVDKMLKTWYRQDEREDKTRVLMIITINLILRITPTKVF